MPARIAYLRPEGCKLWTPESSLLFKENPQQNRSGRWIFPLEDMLTNENRLLVVKVDPQDKVSYYFKSTPLEKFPHFSQLGQLATHICQPEFLQDAIMPNHPVIDGEYLDRAHGPLSFVFTHEDMATNAAPKGDTTAWTMAQLGYNNLPPLPPPQRRA